MPHSLLLFLALLALFNLNRVLREPRPDAGPWIFAPATWARPCCAPAITPTTMLLALGNPVGLRGVYFLMPLALLGVLALLARPEQRHE